MRFATGTSTRSLDFGLQYVAEGFWVTAGVEMKIEMGLSGSGGAGAGGGGGHRVVGVVGIGFPIPVAVHPVVRPVRGKVLSGSDRGVELGVAIPTPAVGVVVGSPVVPRAGAVRDRTDDGRLGVPF